jgi:hypothetical protein
MGGKIAMMVARFAIGGCRGLEDLRGLILVSPSPPGPEPMDEKLRKKLIGELGKSALDAETDREHATDFVKSNVGKLALDEAILSRTVEDVLRMNRGAFVAWLTEGSKRDESAQVGSLHLSALVMAGTEEAALNPEAQKRLTLPHLTNATLIPLVGGGHLAPIERPAELVFRITSFVKTVCPDYRFADEQLAPEFQELIASSRTSNETRAVLNQRLAEDDSKAAGILSSDEMLTLRAFANRIFPGCPFDLASCIDDWLARPKHDGWRPDSLPPDLEAWHIGLSSIDAAAVRKYGVPFVALNAALQDRLLHDARDGDLGRGLLDSLSPSDETRHFTALQMRDWFGEVSAQLTSVYIADPRTMHRIGFSGFADEGGFTQIRINEREDFEL